MRKGLEVLGLILTMIGGGIVGYYSGGNGWPLLGMVIAQIGTIVYIVA